MIQCFEYETLRVGDKGFEEKHFDRLVQYNQQHDLKYFAVGHKRIFFRNYVGVIRVGNLTIEILPKVDRVADTDTALWQKVLLEMLQISKFLKLDTFSKADLKRENYSLFDVYIKLFLQEVSQLIHRGMQKLYILQEENKNVLRGSLMVSKHIQHNLIHRERFFTRHQIYSHNNKFNQILKKALIIIGKICNNSLTEIAELINLSMIYFPIIISQALRHSVRRFAQLTLSKCLL